MVAVPTAVDVFDDFGLELGDGLDEDDEEFDAYFRARRDAVRRTAYLLCGDWDQAG